MHKLSKGLKKKIKGKKGKEKEDDLFDPGELEKHRREVQAANDQSQSADSKPKPESEEWRQFLSLTAGVDSILQKTQEDLSRIKATSYYQRNKKPETPTEPVKTVETPSVKPKWVGFEEGANATEEDEDEAPATAADTQAPVEEVEVQPAATEPEEEELDEAVDEDIFDTTYVDVVTSGEVKLVYVPESPTSDKNAEDDPFDTSTVEKVIGPLPTVQKKRNLVSIGKAVEVLTQAAPSSNLPRAATKRPDSIDLFSCLDDEEAQPNTPTIRDVSSATVQSASSPTEHPLPAESSKLTPDIKDILAEFDSIIETGEVELVQEEEKPKDSDDDEFDALAKESLTKERLPNIKCPENSGIPVTDSEDPFDTTAVERVLYSSPQKVQAKPPRPTPPAKSPARPPKPPAPAVKTPDLREGAQIAVLPSESPVLAREEYDPFDTSIAETVVQPIESPDPFDTTTVGLGIVTQPYNDPIPTVSISSPTADDADYDPFDTSVADHVVP